MHVAQDGEQFLIRLQRGEELFASLTELAGDHDWKAATLTGIGAVESTLMGGYNLRKRAYHKKRYDDIYELVSMQGNLSRVDSQPFFHIHGVLGGHDYACVGGHFFETTCAVTVEVGLRVFNGDITRQFDDEVGLKLLCFADSDLR